MGHRGPGWTSIKAAGEERICAGGGELARFKHGKDKAKLSFNYNYSGCTMEDATEEDKDWRQRDCAEAITLIQVKDDKHLNQQR